MSLTEDKQFVVCKSELTSNEEFTQLVKVSFKLLMDWPHLH